MSESFVILEKWLKVFDRKLLYEIRNKSVLKTLHFFELTFIELGPNFNSVMQLDWSLRLWGNKANPIDFFSAIFGFTQKVKNKPMVNLFVQCLLFVYLEDQPASFGVTFVLPSGLNPISEIINSSDLSLFAINIISIWE